jgi:aryl-alcohol dehydrogenase-like predicted oxidoreductase
MQTRVIGAPLDGGQKRVSRLGLGCSQLGSFGNSTPLADLRALLRRALDQGVNLFDTADIYGQGDSEREIGRAVAGRRSEVFVITKFGKLFSPTARLMRPFKPILKPLLRMGGAGEAVAAQREGVMREDFRPERLAVALDASLGRLKSDHVDAVLLHSPPISVITDPAVAAALESIRASGKARHVGVSVETAAELEAAAMLRVATILQIPLDLAPRLLEGAAARRLADGDLFVFAREILRLQPGVPARDALRRALTQGHLSGLIVGTNRADHLDDLVEVAREKIDLG